MFENTRSQDFRFVFANTFAVTFGPTEVQLIYGIQKKPGSDDPTMEEQVGIIFTHAAAKLIAEMLGLLVKNLEDATGRVIEIEPTKVAGLRQMLDASKAARESAKIAGVPDRPT